MNISKNKQKRNKNKKSFFFLKKKNILNYTVGLNFVERTPKETFVYIYQKEFANSINKNSNSFFYEIR